MKCFDTVLILFALGGGIFIVVVGLAGVWELIESELTMKLIMTTFILLIVDLWILAMRPL